MKYLENAQLDALALALSERAADCRLEARIESYSCKMVQNDKRAWRDFLAVEPGTSPHDREPLSAPVGGTQWQFGGAGQSPLLTVAVNRSRHRSRSTSGSDLDDGTQVMCETISRKLLFHLIALLNASYTDYDFSDAHGENFHRVPNFETLKSSIESFLLPTLDDKTLAQMWNGINKEIQLKECMIYSYNPDYASDPFSEDGSIWSFNYFLYNKRLKRILFFACRAMSPLSVYDSQDVAMWDCD